MLFFSRITSPLLLLAVAASAGAGYFLTVQNRKGSKVVLLGRELPLGQQYGLVALCSLPVFYWAGAGAALFWVLGKEKNVFIMSSYFQAHLDCNQLWNT